MFGEVKNNATCHCLVGTAVMGADGQCYCMNEPAQTSILIPNHIRRQLTDIKTINQPVQTVTQQPLLGQFDLIEWIKNNKIVVVGGVALLLWLFFFSAGGRKFASREIVSTTRYGK